MGNLNEKQLEILRKEQLRHDFNHSTHNTVPDEVLDEFLNDHLITIVEYNFLKNIKKYNTLSSKQIRWFEDIGYRLIKGL